MTTKAESPVSHSGLQQLISAVWTHSNLLNRRQAKPIFLSLSYVSRDAFDKASSVLEKMSSKGRRRKSKEERTKKGGSVRSIGSATAEMPASRRASVRKPAAGGQDAARTGKQTRARRNKRAEAGEGMRKPEHPNNRPMPSTTRPRVETCDLKLAHTSVKTLMLARTRLVVPTCAHDGLAAAATTTTRLLEGADSRATNTTDSLTYCCKRAYMPSSPYSSSPSPSAVSMPTSS